MYDLPCWRGHFCLIVCWLKTTTLQMFLKLCIHKNFLNVSLCGSFKLKGIRFKFLFLIGTYLICIGYCSRNLYSLNSLWEFSFIISRGAENARDWVHLLYCIIFIIIFSISAAFLIIIISNSDMLTFCYLKNK